MFRRTLLRALATCLVCGSFAVAAPAFAAPTHHAPTSSDASVVELQNGLTVDPDG